MSFKRRVQSRFVCFSLVVISLSLLVAFFSGLSIAAHKAGGVVAALSSRPVLVLLAVLAVAGLVKAFFAYEKQREFWGHVAALASAFVAIFIAAEIVLRFAAVRTELGERIGAIQLLPHDWNQVRRTNQKLLQQFRGESAFYAKDPLLGWDVGKNRRSGDYASSAEGIRSAGPDESYVRAGAGSRIALIGDSFTFGEEVAFDETWGHYLEQLSGAQVLNFGVPSHGLDQTLFKFEHKVRTWSPQVVILGMLDAAAPRSGNVYLFLRPDQALPFSKPRFIAEDGELKAINVPVISAEQIYAQDSIFDLLLVEKDVLFQRSHWERSFHDASFVMRYLFSRFPKWDAQPADLSETALDELSARLIEALSAKVDAAEAKLFVVFLPERPQIEGGGVKHRDAIAKSLAKDGIAIFDPTPCLLSRVKAEELFVKGGVHYSAKGNAALAACLAPQIEPVLRETAG